MVIENETVCHCERYCSFSQDALRKFSMIYLDAHHGLAIGSISNLNGQIKAAFVRAKARSFLPPLENRERKKKHFRSTYQHSLLSIAILPYHSSFIIQEILTNDCYEIITMTLTTNKSNKKRKTKRASVPLAPPPHLSTMKSRKKARQTTTLFHKYTRERDLAVQRGADSSELAEYDRKINEIGGREAYQRASQLSTSFHSTSRWVLGVLQRNGWLYGTKILDEEKSDNQSDTTADKLTENIVLKRKRQRRTTRLLEVGAINTELLDAADRKVENSYDDDDKDKHDVNEESATEKKKYRLDVRAIDLNSMYPGRIEEADFLKLPMPNTPEQRYDVIVCSMVLNCVTTAADRGEMLARLYHFLLPGGLLFLTIPKLCLSQSPYIDRERFLQLLGITGVGFSVDETKESPKVAFFLCRRPDEQESKVSERKFDSKWSMLKTIYKGKKYRNKFAVTLDQQSVLGGPGEGKR